METIRINTTGIIGAGNWGTAQAKLLGDKGEKVLLWGHDPLLQERMRRERENGKYLPGCHLPDTITMVDDLKALAVCECLVMVVPSHAFRGVFGELVPFIRPGALVVSAVKGIENDTLQTMTAIMHEELARRNQNTGCRLGVLSGPSFADEVAVGQPTAVTVAFHEEVAATAVQHLFSTDFFRVYTETDIIGLELSSALKNVIAIGAGICDGLGYGQNARAALITRGLAEITRLGVALGAHPLTFAGLGGLGDLVLTCTGSLSRNRTVGLKIGQGKSLSQALAEMTMVAEGVRTTLSCYNLAKRHGVEMPILEQVYAILYEGKDCRQAVVELINRDLKKEKY